MNIKLEEALKTFTLLLPDYFPEKLGNPNDLHRWMDVCYQSCLEDERLFVDDLVAALGERFPDFDSRVVSANAENYMEEYNNYMTLLDYLKKQDYLK